VDALIPDVEQKIRAQRRRLATLMGRSDTTDLGDPVLDLDAWLAQPLPTREAVFAAVEAAYPALRVKRARLAAAEAARGLAWSGWLPDLMVQGSLSEDALGRRESSAMLQLSLPYVWFWRQSGEVQAAAARLEAARAGLEAERLRAREQAATLLDRLAALTESLRILWTRGYPNAVKGLRQARDGFRTTVLGPAEILMAVTDYRMSEEKLAGLVAERGQALAELESLGAGVLSDSKKEKKP
jgi:cobalt-zinc-cadmium efflux system outer membrane protein